MERGNWRERGIHFTLFDYFIGQWTLMPSCSENISFANSTDKSKRSKNRLRDPALEVTTRDHATYPSPFWHISVGEAGICQDCEYVKCANSGYWAWNRLRISIFDKWSVRCFRNLQMARRRLAAGEACLSCGSNPDAQRSELTKNSNSWTNIRNFNRFIIVGIKQEWFALFSKVVKSRPSALAKLSRQIALRVYALMGWASITR